MTCHDCNARACCNEYARYARWLRFWLGVAVGGWGVFLAVVLWLVR